MKFRFSRFSAWYVVPIALALYLLATTALETLHLDFVSNSGGTRPAFDQRSPTGYVDGYRHLIISGHQAESFQWIAQTQHMLATGDWRIHHVDYDNAPTGREVRSASLYRWWLALFAKAHQLFAGGPTGVSVERAALYADPVLQLILLAATCWYVGRRVSPLAAAFSALLIAAIFPLSDAFSSGHPHDQTWALAFALWSLLPIVTGFGQPEESRRKDFRLAGIFAGLCLWLDFDAGLWVASAVILGGLASSALAHARSSNANPETGFLPPWRSWAAGGALGVLIAYLLEYLPRHFFAADLTIIQPLHGLLWLAVGEVLATIENWIQTRCWPRERRARLLAIGSAVFVAAIAFLALRKLGQVSPRDLVKLRVQGLGSASGQESTLAWLAGEGFTLHTCAVLLPVLILFVAAWLWLQRGTSPLNRHRLLWTCVGGLLWLGFAAYQIQNWPWLDVFLLTSGVAVAAVLKEKSAPVQWASLPGVALLLLPGFIVRTPNPAASAIQSVSETEVIELVERDFATWLSTRAGPGRAEVVASPDLAASLIYHGALRAVGTPYPENRDGLLITLRIAGSVSQDENIALIQRRKITHIVLASWDPLIDQIVQIESKKAKNTLVALMQNWLPPRWLRPVPYVLPQIPGFENQSLVVFEVVELQENSVALCRLAEYFLETQQAVLAAKAAEALGQLFSEDLGASIVRMEISMALGEEEKARGIYTTLQSQLANGGADGLTFDQRVSLAILLAQGNRLDQAKPIVERCVNELDEARLRSLTTIPLYRFQVLAKNFGFEFPDRHLQDLARSLLPAEMRSRLP